MSIKGTKTIGNSLIPVTTFAKMAGVTDATVYKWIKEGKITEKSYGYNKANKAKISPIKAANDLLLRADMSNNNMLKIGERIRTIAGKQDAAPKPERKLTAEEAMNVPLEELDYATAKTREQILKVKLMEVTLDEKNKVLVNAEDVRKRLFDYGAEIRTALTTVPDRIVDDLMACNTRGEAYLLLKGAIDAALQKIYDVESRKL